MKPDGGYRLQDWRTLANRMVLEQIVARGIENDKILDAFRNVPRHLFVPPEAITRAYSDFPISIGCGQTISQPYMVARMTMELDVLPGLKVLEIGTGSGYQAAILAELGAKLVTLERIGSLAERAGTALAKSGYSVALVHGDGNEGFPDEAPFDRIIVTAACSCINRKWREQLASQGTIVAPVRTGGGMERLLTRSFSNGDYSDSWSDWCRFVPLVSGPVY